MRRAQVARWTSVLAAVASATVLVLMLYRVSAEAEDGAGLSLDPFGWGVLVSAVACFAVSVALLAYSTFLKRAVEAQATKAPKTAPIERAQEATPSEEEPAPDLSRLKDDERRLYEIIEAAGGEILQMKLVSSGEFSKSKVTRLLDKLEDRGLIKRERYGMTNMVRLTGQP